VKSVEKTGPAFLFLDTINSEATMEKPNDNLETSHEDSSEATIEYATDDEIVEIMKRINVEDADLLRDLA
jgi:hypothetical protein